MKITESFKSRSKIVQIIILLSLIAIIISLTQPAFYIDNPENPAAWANSSLLFFFGWTFPLGGAIVPFLIWCANPIYIVSFVQTIKGKSSGFYLSLVSLVLAFSFSQLTTIITSESGKESEIQSLELGYLFWLTSMLLLSFGSGINLYLNLKKNNNINPQK